MATPHGTALSRKYQGSRDEFQSSLLRSSPDNAKGSFRKLLVNFRKGTQSKFKTLPVEQPAEAEEANWAAFRERKAIQFGQFRLGQSGFRKHSDIARSQSARPPRGVFGLRENQRSPSCGYANQRIYFAEHSDQRSAELEDAALPAKE